METSARKALDQLKRDTYYHLPKVTLVHRLRKAEQACESVNRWFRNTFYLALTLAAIAVIMFLILIWILT